MSNRQTNPAFLDNSLSDVNRGNLVLEQAIAQPASELHLETRIQCTTSNNQNQPHSSNHLNNEFVDMSSNNQKQSSSYINKKQLPHKDPLKLSNAGDKTNPPPTCGARHKSISHGRTRACEACGSTHKTWLAHGVTLCCNCNSFIQYLYLNDKPIIPCARNQNCNKFYKPGRYIKCTYCRVKTLLKLDIKNSSWIRYLEAQGLRSPQGDQQQEPRGLWNDQNPGNGSQAGDDPHEPRLPSQDCACQGCNNITHVRSFHNVMLCDNCIHFIRNTTIRDGPAPPCEGNQSCDVTHKPGKKIKCQRCRIQALAKLDIQDADWIYFVKTRCLDSTHNRKQPEAPIKPANNDKSNSTSAPHVKPTNSQLVCKCCGRAELVDKNHGENLCKSCSRFVCKAANRKFNFKCDHKRRCDIIFKPGHEICKYCRLQAMLKLSITHPAWVDYKRVHYMKTNVVKANDIIDRSTGQPCISGPDHSGCQACGTLKSCVNFFGATICARCKRFVKCVSKESNGAALPCSGNLSCQRFRCAYCLFQRLIKLNIKYPAWARYTTIYKLEKSAKQRATSDMNHGISKQRSPPTGESTNMNRHRCKCCGNTRWVGRHYGEIICMNCKNFVLSLARRGFKVRCSHQRKCSVIHKPGQKICAYCRFKALLKLNITQTDWVSYKKSRGIETVDARGMLTGRPHVKVLNGVCRACGNPSKLFPLRANFGVILCINCIQFIRKAATTNRVIPNCLGDQKCDVDFKPGRFINCAFCRVQKLIKLDITWPYWLEYKKAQGLEKPDCVQQHQKPPDPNGIDGKPESSSNETPVVAGASIDQLSCKVCRNTNWIVKGHGEILCMNCTKFIVRLSRGGYKVKCYHRRDCDISHKPGHKICRFCRVKAMLKLNITHSAWLLYRESLSVSYVNRALKGISKKYKVKSCKVCKNTQDVRLRSIGFMCCKTCWSFLDYSAKNNFRHGCITGHYKCNVLHISKQLYKARKCRGCRIRKAISSGYRHPKLEFSPHRILLGKFVSNNSGNIQHDLAPPVVPPTPPPPVDRVKPLIEKPCPSGSCAICGNTNRLYKRGVTSTSSGFFCCENCYMFLRKSPDRANFPFECVTGRYDCELKHTPQNAFTQANRMCRGCRTRKAMSLGYNFVRHEFLPQDDQPRQEPIIDTRETAEPVVETIAEETPIAETSAAPVFPATRPTEPHKFKILGGSCAICRSKEGLTMKPGGYICCGNCSEFLEFSSGRSDFPYKCRKGQYDCKLKHRPHKRKKMCWGCRARKAISLGYKHPKLHTELQTDHSSLDSIKTADITNVVTDVPSESPTEEGPEEACNICNSTKNIRLSSYGVQQCRKCRDFLKGARRNEGGPYECVTGQWNCELRYTTRKEMKICSGCRLKTAIDLGFKNSKAKSLLRFKPQQVSEGVGANGDSPTRLFVDNSTQIGELPLIIDQQSIACGPDEVSFPWWVTESSEHVSTGEQSESRTVRTVRMDDLEPQLDEDGVPENISWQFSRWFYDQDSLFRPGSSARKLEQDEVFPSEPDVHLLVYCNDISSPKLGLLTRSQNNPFNRPAAKEIVTPKLHIRPSSRLTRAHSGLFEMSDEQDGDEQYVVQSDGRTVKPKRSKAKVTLTLEIQRTIIDRTPMLKKLKTTPGAVSRNHPDYDDDTYLIAPGEDCDLYDDNDLIEMDCD